MVFASGLERGRDAFARLAWAEAYAQLAAAERESPPLAGEDLERFAKAAYLTGHEAEALEILARAHQAYGRSGDARGAARCAFWIGHTLMSKGDLAPAAGWLGRAERLLDEEQLDCVERGYLMLPVALRHFLTRNNPAAQAAFTQAAAIGNRFGDPDLVTLGRMGAGWAQIRMREIPRGLALLDEVMVAVTSGEVSVPAAGIVYCNVIEACREIFDLRRAREWTEELTRWCASQPDLVPYRGTCLLHRAEIMQLCGAWPDAMDEARRAIDALTRPPVSPLLGAALYQQGELHRLRGDFEKAEDTYRQASQHGFNPQPGLALLRLAQGNADTALAAIRSCLEEGQSARARPALLAAEVEIAIGAGDVATARSAAEDLSGLCGETDTAYLRAVAGCARGCVLIAEGDARGALSVLRRAWSAWQELDAVYEGARVRVHVALASRALGDPDTAAMELDAARAVFQQLGAAPDVARIDALSQAASAAAGPLSTRELQVLRLLAAGKTNRAIAMELLISEKTVARHASNIFAKLGLSSRSAATAYAYGHGLV